MDLAFECNAPRMVDFSQYEEDLDDGADKFFDVTSPVTPVSTMDFHTEPIGTPQDTPKFWTPRDTPHAANDNTESDVAYGKTLPNIVTSFNKPAKKSILKPVAAVQDKARKKVTPTKRASSFNNKMVTRSAKKTQDKENLSVDGMSVRPHRRSMSTSDVHQRKNWGKPQTPQFVRRTLAQQKKSLKSSQDLEMEQVRILRKQVAQYRKISQDSHKMTKDAKYPSAVKPQPVIPPTKVSEFHFEVDKRLKDHAMVTRQDPRTPDFAANLRKYQSESTHYFPVATRVMPFHLTENRKRSRENDPKPMTPLAERVMKFHKSTPERFRTRRGELPPEPKRRCSLHITVPNTPQFHEVHKRRVSYLPQEEREKEELEEIKKHQFKAQPYDLRKFRPKGAANIVQKKAPTVVKPFNLTQVVPKKFNFDNNSDPKKWEFHARPVPVKILEGPTGIKEAPETSLTHPQSPAFARRRSSRVKSRSQLSLHSASQPNLSSFKARPVPFNGVPFRPALQHNTTEIQPFSFNDNDEKRFAEKEEKIKKYWEEEQKKHEFYANPLPSLTPQGIPKKKVRPSTRFQPFSIRTDTRGNEHAAKFQKEVEEELEEQRKKALFKARSPRVLRTKKFTPIPSCKPLTEKGDFKLHTEVRAVEREDFEMQQKEKEAYLAAVAAEKEKLVNELEEQEIRKLRINAVHRAQPVPVYKPVEIRKSDKPLTQPLTPRFSVRPLRK